MEIRNNPVGTSATDPIDLTKANRDAIRERNPSPPAQPKPVAADQFIPSDPKRVENARDAIEHAASVQKRVEDARDRFQVHKRVQDARTRFAKESSEDQITVSPNGKELAETTIQPSPTDVNVAARAKRVDDLKAQYQNGQLDVSSLVAESAYRMLGGD